MRIRTIKPEFWKHPIMGRLSERDQLTAIGILNCCDDEGYFIADPDVIRAEIAPFTDSSVIVQGSITHLCMIGYLEIVEHVKMGKIGRVVNFLDHQVINRPKPSKIKTYFVTDESLTNHGLITDASLRKGKEQGTGNGTGNREQQAPVNVGLSFPDSFSCALKDSIASWSRVRYQQHSLKPGQEWADAVSKGLIDRYDSDDKRLDVVRYCIEASAKTLPKWDVAYQTKEQARPSLQKFGPQMPTLEDHRRQGDLIP